MRLFKTFEFVTIFLLLPVVIFVTKRYGLRLELPTLLLTSGYCIWRLVSTGSPGSSFFSFQGIAQAIPGILVRWGVGTVVLATLMWGLAPEQLFAFPQHRPTIWALVLVLYPLLSVFPQEIIYRLFLFQAYPLLHGNDRLRFVLLSATVYSFVHIVYGNWIAIFLTFAGGLMFSHTYLQTRSLPAVWLEHSLWGNTIFTVGLGRFFYHAWT